MGITRDTVIKLAKNELGIENKLCLVISDVLKRIAPWSTCLMSLAIGKKVRNV